MTENDQEDEPQEQNGGFEFGSFGTPDSEQPEPAPMSDMERLLAKATGKSNSPDLSDYRSDGGGPLVAGEQGMYTDMESLGGDIDVKFGRNELLKVNGSQVYMLDAKGVPHFIRPWTPESAVKLTSSMITKFQLTAAVLLLCAAGLSLFGAFTDTDYVGLMTTGKEVTATVSSEVFNGLTGDQAGSFDHVRTLSYGTNSSVVTHEITATPSSDGADTLGMKMKILVDPTNKNHFAFVRTGSVPVWSPFSLLPLIGIGLIASKWAHTITINRKMKILASGGIPQPKSRE